MTDQPFVSVLIPALNCAVEVADCVAALRAQDYPADRFEILIVDNGSTDGTLERIRESGVQAPVRPERGRSRALNAGLKHTRGEIICTTDISCRPEPGWISAIVGSFRDPAVGCVAGEIRMLPDSDNAALRFQNRTGYLSPMAALQRRQLPFLPFADGANASFRRQVFEEIGPFEESFTKGADVEICYRLFLLTRYQLLFNYNAVVWEPGEPNLKALLKQRFRIGIGWNLMRMKYPQLYESQRSSRNPRQMYWAMRQTAGNACGLIADNLRALFGAKRSAAEDRNLRMLMSLAQAYGRWYGRWHLAVRGIRPEPVDPARLAAFIADERRLDGRVTVVGAEGSCQNEQPPRGRLDE